MGKQKGGEQVMSNWQTPKTNWGQPGQTVPGATDFNRIEGNIQYLQDTKETPAGAQAKVDTHAALTTAHSATSAATANRIMMRDANGRAQVAAPSASADIARKDNVDTVQNNLNAKMHATTGHKHSGTTGDGPKIPVANVDFSGMTGFRELVLFGTTSQTAIANGTITRDQSDSSSSLTWHSFGPTGSGCSVILAGLDSVPSDAKAVLFDLYANCALEATLVMYAYVYVRKYGASEYAELNSGHGRPHLPVIVKCDSTRRFEFYYYLVNWGGNSIKVSLTGYVR